MTVCLVSSKLFRHEQRGLSKRTCHAVSHVACTFTCALSCDRLHSCWWSVHPSHRVAVIHSQHRVSLRAACTVAHRTTVAMHVGAWRCIMQTQHQQQQPVGMRGCLLQLCAHACGCQQVAWLLVPGTRWSLCVCVSTLVGHLWRHCPGGWGWAKVPILESCASVLFVLLLSAAAGTAGFCVAFITNKRGQACCVTLAVSHTGFAYMYQQRQRLTTVRRGISNISAAVVAMLRWPCRHATASCACAVAVCCCFTCRLIHTTGAPQPDWSMLIT